MERFRSFWQVEVLFVVRKSWEVAESQESAEVRGTRVLSSKEAL